MAKGDKSREVERYFKCWINQESAISCHPLDKERFYAFVKVLFLNTRSRKKYNGEWLGNKIRADLSDKVLKKDLDDFIAKHLKEFEILRDYNKARGRLPHNTISLPLPIKTKRRNVK